MLKSASPGRARTLCGAAVTAALVCAGSVAAWAAQPANVILKSAHRIRADVTLRINSGVEHRMVILTPPDIEFAVADGDDTDRWELRGTATPREDGTLELNSTVRHNDTLVGAPRLIVNDGVSAGMRVDDPDSALAQLDASFVLTRTDATVPTPAPAATENTIFRRMNPPSYPRAAIDAHQSGRVVLRVHVDEQGNPQTAQIAEVEPAQAAGLFSEASIAAAMQWRYNPGMIDGKPAPGDVAVPIDFTLTDD